MNAARRKAASEPAASEPAAGYATEPAAADAAEETAEVGTDAPARKSRARRADGLPGRAASTPVVEERSALDLARRIVELVEDKKAADIVLLELSPLTTVADYFVICSGGSERQLEAIAGGVISGMRDERIRPFGREGTAASHWILVDFGSVIVHIFTPPERDFYQLERHWAEAKTILRLQ
ncbi:MAG: ribosome silencing factor [Chloroflexota bacterium]